jgi:hypothetical protein
MCCLFAARCVIKKNAATRVLHVSLEELDAFVPVVMAIR